MSLRRRLRVTVPLYVVLFGLLALPWWRHLGDALPEDDFGQDAWLILWVLDWCRHALVTAPTRLFDPPVNFPAPGQLTGSEHFLSAQLLFAPLRAVTGDSVVAANLTAFLCYPLAAAAMDAFLVALGVGPGASLAAGFLYGFGYSGRAARLHILQLVHAFLPLVALALHRLRARPAWRRAGVLALVYGVGLFSSYHMAVYLTVAGMVWGVAELASRGVWRVRFGALAIGACAIAGAALLAFSRPYLARPEAAGDLPNVVSTWNTLHLGEEGGAVRVTVGVPALLEAFGGCVAAWGASLACYLPLLGVSPWPTFLSVERLVNALVLVAGLACAYPWLRVGRARVVGLVGVAAAGFLLASPIRVAIGPLVTSTPSDWLRSTPARFIRAPDRAFALTFFGSVALVGIGLDGLRRRLGRRAGAVVMASVAVLGALWQPQGDAASPDPTTHGAGRWSRFAPGDFLPSAALGPERDAYEQVAAFVQRAGPGPLLEWPRHADDPDIVVGQMIHRQPSIDFFTGYEPPHTLLVKSLVAKLPTPGALDDLVDMTGLTWVLVPPGSSPELVRRLVHHPRVKARVPIGGFTLVRLDPTSRHPDWFASLARGVQPGCTVLGTPLAPLPAATGVRVVATPPPTVPPRRRFPLSLAVSNDGPGALPAALPGRGGRPFTVRLELAWERADGGAVADEPVPVELRRDVPANETLVQMATVAAPAEPGAYVLRVTARQVDGPDLGGAGNPGHAPVNVKADLGSTGTASPTPSSP